MLNYENWIYDEQYVNLILHTGLVEGFINAMDYYIRVNFGDKLFYIHYLDIYASLVYYYKQAHFNLINDDDDLNLINLMII